MRKNYNAADAEWEWYIGQLYYQLIRNLYKKEIKCVVELAPGFRHKIAVTLKELKFDGTIYVIDYSDDVLNYVQSKYKEILPDATIICINKKFEESLNLIPEHIDLFLSNHSIDDLIISRYSNSEYNAEINNELLYNYLLELWEKLSNDSKSIKNITEELVKAFKKLFSNKNIGLIIMSQYKSNSYFLGKSNSIDEIVDNCFEKIKQLTDTDDENINKLLDFYPFGKDDERYNGKYLINNTQNAKHWIVGIVNEKICTKNSQNPKETS